MADLNTHATLKKDIETIRLAIMTRSDSAYRTVDNLNTSDEFIQRFLVRSHNNPEKAYRRYTKYYEGLSAVKGLNDILYGNPCWYLHALEQIRAMELIQSYGVDKFGRRVFLLHIKNVPSNLSKEDLEHFRKAFLLQMATHGELIARDHPDTYHKGAVYLVNYIGFTAAKVMAWSDRNLLKLFNKLMFGANPLLMQGLLIFNEPAMLTQFVNNVMPYFFDDSFKRKLAQKVRFLGNNEQAYIAKISQELGGLQYVPSALPGGLAEKDPPPTSEELLESLMKSFPD